MAHGLLRGEASHRWLRNANEHAFLERGAAVGRRWRLLRRLTISKKTKLCSKLARGAQFMVVLHDSGEKHVDVSHELDVGPLLKSMKRAQLDQAITPTGLVTFAGRIVSNTVEQSMVGAHSSRVNVIKGSMGFMP